MPSSFFELSGESLMKALRLEGWTGFYRVHQISSECAEIPEQKGVYLVVCDRQTCPDILSKSVGGWFKKRDPTVSPKQLEQRWIVGTSILYIGQTGGGRSSENLRKRLKTFLKFGSGLPVGHWGGRLIWQLSSSSEFILCWKETPKSNPQQEELALLDDFIGVHKRLPFANLKRG